MGSDDGAFGGALSEGLPLFTTLTRLSLQEARPFPNGVVALTYTTS